MSTSPSAPAETPFSTGTSSGGKASDSVAKPPTKASRQRFKPQLSCTLCRTRKLKCDRNLPCQNCIKRDLQSSCTFIHAGLRREKAAAMQKPGNVGRKDVQSQISHLEQLVVSLMKKSGGIDAQNRPGSSRGHSSDDPRAPDFTLSTGEDQWTEINGLVNTTESFGMINIDDDQPNYVGSAHWAAILDNIACLKDTIENTDPPKQVQQEDKMATPQITGPDLLNGSVKSATRTEILSALPNRKQVDSLLGTYFAIPDLSTLVHQQKFRNECEKFWEDPMKTPITWVGLLFAILGQSLGFEIMDGRNPFNNTGNEIAARDPAEIVDMYRHKTVQCLYLGNYTEPGPYTIETLLLYYVNEHFRSQDAQFGTWMLFGMTIRAALRLGLHRDASHYPKISVFQGEMNRRIWSTLVHLDLLTSCQVGLPRMIREGMHDAQCPSNLVDDDFNESTIILPPPRPAEDLTPIGCFNAKHQITEVFGTIVDQANSTELISYDSVMKLDKSLHATFDQTPELLKAYSVEDLRHGTSNLRTQKFGIGLTFQKSKCILHRKFFTLSKTGPTTYPYPYSMKACVDSSMHILESQILMHREMQPGMPLFEHRWKSSSLISHDFLLAAMLICLYIGHTMAHKNLEQTMAQLGIRVKATREEMIQVLNDSHNIWEATSSTSQDAFKAAKTLKAMLYKVRAAGPALPFEVKTTVRGPLASSSSSSMTTPSQLNNSTAPWLDKNVVQPTTYSWSTPPSFDPPSNDTSNTEASAQSSLDIGNMELDWELWDNQFYNNGGTSRSPPDIWNFDPENNTGIQFPDPNSGFMQWEQQI